MSMWELDCFDFAPFCVADCFPPPSELVTEPILIPAILARFSLISFSFSSKFHSAALLILGQLSTSLEAATEAAVFESDARATFEVAPAPEPPACFGVLFTPILATFFVEDY